MGVPRWLGSWPIYRQLTGPDRLGRGAAAESPLSAAMQPRTATADRVVKSVCPYCAVGCGQKVYVQDGRILDIEGDADSPISRGRLGPKGAATFQLVTGDHRLHHCLYRRPRGKEWELIPLEKAMDMV